MLAKCKKALGRTLTIVQQLQSPRETTLAIVRFITTTRAGRCSQRRELKEATKQTDEK